MVLIYLLHFADFSVRSIRNQIVKTFVIQSFRVIYLQKKEAT